MKKIIPFTNTKLKKIINVYQKRGDNHKTYGFGDFLRGCFCLIQICKKNKLEFDIDISNHPMSNYIVPSETTYNVDYLNLPHFENINYLCIDGKTNTTNSWSFYWEFINHLNSLDMEHYYLECNSFPAWNKVQYIEKHILKYKLSPTKDMQLYISDTLHNLELDSTSFGIIHIRTGDSYLIDGKKLEANKLYKIFKALVKVTNKDKKYLLLSDNNFLKIVLKKRFHNICCYTFPITHLGESNDQTNDSLKNTMLDFFIIGNAKLVISLSFHNWGSGFSEWSSVMHNVPYTKFIIT
jgi:hypothetical protein